MFENENILRVSYQGPNGVPGDPGLSGEDGPASYGIKGTHSFSTLSKFSDMKTMCDLLLFPLF
jgi:hypothetical protein